MQLSSGRSAWNVLLRVMSAGSVLEELLSRPLRGSIQGEETTHCCRPPASAPGRSPGGKSGLRSNHLVPLPMRKTEGNWTTSEQESRENGEMLPDGPFARVILLDS